MVVRTAVLDVLIRNIRIEDRLDAARDEILDMTMRELCRIAHRLRRDRLHSALIELVGGSCRYEDPESELGKHGEPERIILILVKYARDSYLSSRSILSLKRLIVECPLILVFEYVRKLLLILNGLPVECDVFASLASVSRYESLTVGEFRDGDTAVVGTSRALCVLGLHGE